MIFDYFRKRKEAREKAENERQEKIRAAQQTARTNARKIVENDTRRSRSAYDDTSYVSPSYTSYDTSSWSGSSSSSYDSGSSSCDSGGGGGGCD